jgi:plastocyanin
MAAPMVDPMVKAAGEAIDASYLSVTPDDTTVVRVFNFDYSAAPAGEPALDPTIDVGDTVLWQWTGGFHNVLAVTGSAEPFNSGAPGVGLTYSYTFTIPGIYTYYCTVHGSDNGDGTANGMVGTITVVPEPASVASLGLMGLLLGRRRSTR